MMDRRSFIATLASGLLAAPLPVEAQQRQPHRVGLLNGATEGQVEAAFREGLHALGYAEGTNLVIDARAARGRVERLPILIARAARCQARSDRDLRHDGDPGRESRHDDDADRDGIRGRPCRDSARI